MKNPEEKSTTRLQELASLCSTFAVAFFVMTFLFQNFAIPSSSMASTLLVGDHVLVERVGEVDLAGQEVLRKWATTTTP